MKKWCAYKHLLAFVLLVIYIQPAHAYLDPGTGSMLLAALVGIVSTLIFTLRSFWHKIRVSISPSSSHSTQNTTYQNIIFYSEGSQYWNTYLPVISALHEKQVQCTYLSSDIQDAGLQFKSPFVHTQYIGKNNKAYTYLNLLKAQICVLTTPNFDVLQIRRSKGVRHYTHIIHAPTDIHLYKLFGFDFYDSIMISGPHQEKSIRFLEELRQTAPKQMYPVGCTYMDVLLEKKQKHQTENANIKTMKTQSHNSHTILVAPTWGESGLLTQYGISILQPLVDAGFNIIVRPHPQSVAMETELIGNLQESFKHTELLTFDTTPDNFASMTEADILISDRSGIIFDFCFIFEKPVITNKSSAILLGMEGNDLPWNAWELDILNKIGATINSESVSQIHHIVENSLKNPNQYKESITQLRNQYLYNLGSAGQKAAEQLIDLIT